MLYLDDDINKYRNQSYNFVLVHKITALTSYGSPPPSLPLLLISCTSSILFPCIYLYASYINLNNMHSAFSRYIFRPFCLLSAFVYVIYIFFIFLISRRMRVFSLGSRKGFIIGQVDSGTRIKIFFKRKIYFIVLKFKHLT